MRDIILILRDKRYHLAFNGAAMFAIRDKYDNTNIFELLEADSGDGFLRLCDITAILSEQGELVRRYEGHDKGPVLTAEAMKILAGPMDVTKIRYAAMQAIMAGYGREIQDEEIDLGLLELNKKKEPASPAPTT